MISIFWKLLGKCVSMVISLACQLGESINNGNLKQLSINRCKIRNNHSELCLICFSWIYSVFNVYSSRLAVLTLIVLLHTLSKFEKSSKKVVYGVGSMTWLGLFSSKPHTWNKAATAKPEAAPHTL